MMNQNKCIASVILVVLVSSFFLGCGGEDENEDAKQAEVDFARQAQLNQQEEATSKKALEEAVALLWNKSSEDERYDWKQYMSGEAILHLKISSSWDAVGWHQEIINSYEEYLSVIVAAEEKATAKKAAEAPSALLWNTSDRKERNAWKELTKWSKNIDTADGWDDMQGSLGSDFRRELVSTYEQYLTMKTADEEASKREAAFQERMESVDRLFPDNSTVIVDIARYINNIEEIEDAPAQVLAELLFDMRGAKEYYSENPPEERGAVWYEISYQTSRGRKKGLLTKSMFNYCLKFIEQTVENSSYKKTIEATAQLVALCRKKSEVSDFELAIDQGALVDISILGRTPLMLAIGSHNEAEVLFKLLDLGSPINASDTKGYTPLMYAINLGYSEDVISRMLSIGAIAKSRNFEDDFPLMMAVKSNNRKIVSLLLQSYKCGNPQCDFYSEYFFDLETPDWAQDNLVCPRCDEPARKNQIMFPGGVIKRVNLEGPEGQKIDIGINSTSGDLQYLDVRHVWSGSEFASQGLPWGITPLIQAILAEEIDSEMVSLLIKAGADVNHLWHVGSEDELALTPLQAALMNGASLEKVNELMNSGADASSPLIEYRKRSWSPFATPLMIACKHQTVEVVSALLEHLKAKGDLSNTIEIDDADGMTALCHAAKYSESPEIISELIKYGAEINKFSKFEDEIPATSDFGLYQSFGELVTPLMLAAMSNNAEVVKILIENGSDVHLMTTHGKTALMFAAHYNANDSVCSELINSGAKVNETNPVVGLTPLIYASTHNDNPDVISTLVEAGASIGQRATAHTSEAYEKFLAHLDNHFDYRNHGLTLSKSSVKEMTPLMFASRWNQNPEIVKRLLHHGSDIHACDIEGGFSPIHHAAQHNQVPGVVKALIDAGADLNSASTRTKVPRFPVLLAGFLNTESVCSVLIDAGADITVTVTSRGGDVLTLFNLMTRNEFINGTPLWHKIRDLTLAEVAK